MEVGAASQLDEIPDEIRASVLRLVGSVDEVESGFDAVMTRSYDARTGQMTPLEKAKMDLTFLYGMNALYWVYLRCQGHDPSAHSVRSELDRVVGLMRRVQSEADKVRRPRVDVDAAKRFVKASLWRAAHDKAKKRRQRKEKSAAAAGDDDDDEADGDSSDSGAANNQGERPV